MAKVKQINWRTDTNPKPRKPARIRLEPTMRCMELVGSLIYWERLMRKSKTKPGLGYLTRSELARMASKYLDSEEPQITGQTIKALEEDPSPTRAFRLIAVVRALGYTAVLKPM